VKVLGCDAGRGASLGRVNAQKTWVQELPQLDGDWAEWYLVRSAPKLPFLRLVTSRPGAWASGASLGAEGSRVLRAGGNIGRSGWVLRAALIAQSRKPWWQRAGGGLGGGLPGPPDRWRFFFAFEGSRVYSPGRAQACRACWWRQ